MTGIEICLIIVGIACVCASYFVSQKTASQDVSDSYGGGHPSAEVWTEKDEQIVKQRLEEILQEQQEEYVDEAKDRMGQICNEKIMAVDEFSKQILEKINSNHQEVVFMYNMLNEKQKELKMVMTETARPAAGNSSQKEVSVSGAAQPGVVPQERERKPVSVKNAAVAAPAANASSAAFATPEVDLSIFKPPSTQAGALTGLAQVRKSAPASKKASAAKSSQSSVNRKQGKSSSAVQAETALTDMTEENLQTTETSENVNLQIQKMYKAGKSVLDISKELDIGQGEVKLVIALYEGRKR